MIISISHAYVVANDNDIGLDIDQFIHSEKQINKKKTAKKLK